MADIRQGVKALEYELERAEELLQEDPMSRKAMMILAGLMSELQVTKVVGGVPEAISKIKKEIAERKKKGV
jgi:hypothetical protein